LLAAWNVDYLQGFGMGRPMTTLVAAAETTKAFKKAG
jgi:hypothetical protein